MHWAPQMKLLKLATRRRRYARKGRLKVVPDEASLRQDSLRQDSLKQRVARFRALVRPETGARLTEARAHERRTRIY